MGYPTKSMLTALFMTIQGDMKECSMVHGKWCGIPRHRTTNLHDANSRNWWLFIFL